MIEINAGDSVRLPDGTIVKVLGYYNQGKHRIFKLEGGDTAMDIHKAPGAEVVEEKKPKPERRSGTLEVNLKKRPPRGPTPVDPFEMPSGDDLSTPNGDDLSTPNTSED